ncbi:MAG: hypothetical protein U0990_04945 [Candidatus Nanopelagicales bacterium]|nr:hypothetical protein [Candidatus Nanopelagicales bacterium]MDZ4249420.1 hypothetical protein [Candidatus Nanopelagicales bacterium]
MSGENPNDSFGSPAGPGVPPPPDSGGAPGFPTAPLRFSLDEAFRYAWKKFKPSWGSWVLATLIFGVILAAVYAAQMILAVGLSPVPRNSFDRATGAYTYSTGSSGAAFALVVIALLVVFLLLMCIFQAQFARGALECTKADRISLGVFFRGRFLGAAVLASVLVAVLTLVGVVLCILPGILAAFFLQFFLYFILDRGQAPIGAIGSSWSFVKRNWVNVLLLNLVFVGVYAMGIFALYTLIIIVSLIVMAIASAATGAATVVGVILGILFALLFIVAYFIVVPVALIAHAYTYRVLSGQPVAA